MGYGAFEAGDGCAQNLHRAASQTGYITDKAQLRFVKSTDGLACGSDGCPQKTNGWCYALQGGTHGIGCIADLSQACADTAAHAVDRIVDIAKNAASWLSYAAQWRAIGGGAQNRSDYRVDICDDASGTAYGACDIRYRVSYRSKRSDYWRWIASVAAAVAATTITATTTVVATAVIAAAVVTSTTYDDTAASCAAVSAATADNVASASASRPQVTA